VYGRRGTDLQWDLWAFTPDPVGIGGSSFEPAGELSLSLEGRNPFQGSIVFNITSSAPARLRIFDLSGRIVRDDQVGSGLYTWAGTLGSGGEAPSGVYFAVVSSGSGMDSCRLVKI